jgi:hypothetical protein
MTTKFMKLDQLLTEIEHALIPDKEPKRKRGVLYATLWALEAISEMSLVIQYWTASPKGLLNQLFEEFEEWEKLRWGDRIHEILKEI